MIRLVDIGKVSPQELQLLANDVEISKNLRDIFPHPYTLDDAKEFIRLNKEGIITNSFAIFSDDIFIGMGGIVSKNDIHRLNGEIGYWLGQKYWGKGYATEAVKLITDYAFEKLKLHRVYAGIFETNKASMKVLEKAGYKLEAVIKSSVVKNNVIMDEYLWSKLKL
jgi:ribosomal-protein-alanine N-acetyltransferase